MKKILICKTCLTTKNVRLTINENKIYAAYFNNKRTRLNVFTLLLENVVDSAIYFDGENPS